MAGCSGSARAALVALALTIGANDGAAQRAVSVGVAAGYAGGLDAPVLANGGLTLHGTVWFERRRGVEFGLGAGNDRFEDRSLRTRNLYLDPVSGSTGTTACTGCIAGSYVQDTRMTATYVTPMVRVRMREGSVQPYASLGLGLYQVRDRDRGSFLPAAGGAALRETEFTSSRWTGGGNVRVGVQVPVNSRLSLDASAQLHGAALIGNDYAGGTGYGAFAVGMTYR